MDILSRLIAGSAASSPTKQRLNTPAERFSGCKRLCNALQQIWRNNTRLSEDDNASSHVANLLNRLNTVLNDESRKAAPHSCLSFCTSQQIYIIVVKLALSSDNPEVVTNAAQFFHLLINGEADGLLDSRLFARSLVDLVKRSTQAMTVIVNEQEEADLVELLFEIATKIRLDPEILPGWFYPEKEQSRTRAAGAEARRAQFPLFYLLVDFVHHDGPTGDFARTGLLYLTETASRSKPLERWMIESDLAPQMASGLSALYGRLSRHSPVLSEVEKNIPIIALSDYAGSDSPPTDDSTEESQQNIRAFLSYLAFWQDTLNHCKSQEVKDTLLDHFQVLFVQQLLYPSLLESSDVAGGSTSAVILHLYRILDTADNPLLIRRMLQYLLASSKPAASQSQQPGHSRARMSISRRKSMEQLATLADMANAPSPDLFNLLDLLVISLHSRYSQTVNASLKLITIILRRHHQYVVSELFNTTTISEAESTQNLDDFNTTLVKMLNLSEAIAQTNTADQSYQAALNDGQLLLERHSCLLAKTDVNLSRDLPTMHQAIAVDCRLFEAVTDLLMSFFANETITNITLTETIVALASCEHISIQSWLLPGPERIKSRQSSLLEILTELAEQVGQWRSQFSDWDALLAYQRIKLSLDEDNTDLSSNASSTGPPRAASMQRSGSARSTDGVSIASQASTPRGRNPMAVGFASIDGALASANRLGTSPAKALPNSPLRQSNFPEGITDARIARRISSGSAVVPNLSQLRQQIRLPSSPKFDVIDSPFPQLAERLRLDGTGSGASTPRTPDLDSGPATPMLPEHPVRETASLSHILTNAVILQEFIFEVSAIFQIRGTLFDEVSLV